MELSYLGDIRVGLAENPRKVRLSEAKSTDHMNIGILIWYIVYGVEYMVYSIWDWGLLGPIGALGLQGPPSEGPPIDPLILGGPSIPKPYYDSNMDTLQTLHSGTLDP